MPGYLANADTTPLADVSGTAFSHLEVKYLVSSENSNAQLTFLGQTVYPAGGATHEAHYHPNAEETIIVQSGSGRHRVGDDWFDLAPGDILFVPKGSIHTAESGQEEDLVIFWVLGGAGSLETAGYVPAED